MRKGLGDVKDTRQLGGQTTDTYSQYHRWDCSCNMLPAAQLKTMKEPIREAATELAIVAVHEGFEGV